MAKSIRVAVLVVAYVLVSFSAIILFVPQVAAATTTWTTDADFNEVGAIFNGVEVVGAGTAARVELLKDTTDWANRNPPTPPGWREGPSLVFSPVSNVSVLFGGYNGTDLDQTWEYDYGTNTWTRILGDPHPKGRAYAGMSYDPVDKVMVLFGGINATDPDAFLTDTWEYDVVTKTWTQTGAPGTGPMMIDTPLAYDASAAGGEGRHILFGWNYSNSLMQTWAYDAATNGWTNRFPSSQPGQRSGQAMAYHATRQRVVLFGGTNPFPPPGTNLADTWEYNYAGNTWSQIFTSPSPSARATHAMTYRSSTTSVLLFGGLGTGAMSDTWQYTAAGAWSQLSTATMPPARRFAGFAFDSKESRAILYGGTTGSGARLGDTWALGSAYRSAGKYTSSVHDAGGFANWGELWWNKTTQPPQTFLRFQIATSNDAAGPWNFHGPAPACAAIGYYTIPGTAIGTCSSPPQDDGRRYIRFLADFGTFNAQNTPSMEDVTFTFVVPPAPPCLISTDPPDLTFNVPVTKEPVITFSKTMDRTTVSWAILLPVSSPNNFTAEWNADSTILTLRTVGWDLRENTVYRLRIIGKDTQGNSLSALCPDGSAGAPNPFTFVTWKINPWIQSTNPAFGAQGVPWAAPIIVEFSEPMDPDSVASSLTPPNVVLNPSWSNGDQTLTFNHDDYTQCTPYQVHITAAKDKAGLPIVPGPVPNPWSFVSFCDNPYIVSTNPADLQPQIPVAAPVVVTFSEPMLRSSLSFDIRPNVAGQQLFWSNGDTVLTMTHSSPFIGCGVYTVNVSATDVQGKPLIPHPTDPTVVNPWKFVTVCANPYIVFTDPEDGKTDVQPPQEVTIQFSEMMNTGSVIVQTTPSFSEVGRRWDLDTVLHIQFATFTQCLQVTVRVVQALNTAGAGLVPGPVPNPWSFNIVCNAPYLTSTDPVDGETLVPVDRIVVVSFSKPMNTSTVVATLFPADVPFTYSWSNQDMTLTLTHPNFVDCQQYSITLTGLSQDSFALITGPNAPGQPNPWTFTTRCSGFYLLDTNPADQQQDVPRDAAVVVEFSQVVDISTFNLTLSPTVTQDLPVWSQGNTVVTVTHATMLFQECRTYTATVVAKNVTGSSLQSGIPGSAPNPWTFKAHCIPPQILSTSPVNGAVGVPQAAPIMVKFSEAMLRGSLSWLVAPGGVTFIPNWSEGDTNLTLTHTGPLLAGTVYTVRITGTDLDGTPLAPGPAPNPWSFTTSLGLSPPPGLQVILQGNDILLDWGDVSGASTYVVYSSLDRFRSWPWPEIATVPAPTTSYFAGGHGNDGATHYYIVRAEDSVGAESRNSTMGVKAHLSFSFNAARSSINWMSFPYRSKYAKASDISDELSAARIDVVGKWQASEQTSLLWVYFRGAWRGINFPIQAGDGIYIGVRATFTWVVTGTDGPVSLPFTFYPAPNANVNWVSLPYTGTYRRASDIVLDIEGNLGPTANTRIIEVARWDPFTQQYVTFSWTVGGWTGTDFPLMIGEGLYMKVVSSFSWSPRLLTPEVP